MNASHPKMDHFISLCYTADEPVDVLALFRGTKTGGHPKVFRPEKAYSLFFAENKKLLSVKRLRALVPVVGVEPTRVVSTRDFEWLMPFGNYGNIQESKSIFCSGNFTPYDFFLRNASQIGGRRIRLLILFIFSKFMYFLAYINLHSKFFCAIWNQTEYNGIYFPSQIVFQHISPIFPL